MTELRAYSATPVRMHARQQIRRFIMENYLFTTDDAELGDADSLELRGVIDSTGGLELILFLEETFGLTVEEDEMVPENLDSVDQIMAYLGRKVVAAP